MTASIQPAPASNEVLAVLLIDQLASVPLSRATPQRKRRFRQPPGRYHDLRRHLNAQKLQGPWLRVPFAGDGTEARKLLHSVVKDLQKHPPHYLFSIQREVDPDTKVPQHALLVRRIE